MTNCLNCGAPLDKEYEKCPYCGTSYYDMSAITLDGHTPFVFKFRTVVNNKPITVTQLCRATAVVSNISYNSNPTTTIDFEAIPSIWKNFEKKAYFGVKEL